jgi:hypothetical protein
MWQPPIGHLWIGLFKILVGAWRIEPESPAKQPNDLTNIPRVCFLTIHAMTYI